MDYRFTAVAKHTGNPLGQTAEKLERLLLTHGQSPFLCLIGNGVIIMISQQIVNIISTKNKYWSSSAKICEQFTPISYGSVARQSCLRRKNGCSGCVVCWIFGRWFWHFTPNRTASRSVDVTSAGNISFRKWKRPPGTVTGWLMARAASSAGGIW